MRECSDSAGELSHAHCFDGFFESRLLPFHFVEEKCEFEPERRWLGMNAMGSSDNHGCLEFMSAFLQYIEESPKIFQNDCGCIGHLQRHSGIEDIGGREAEMKISRSRAHELRNRSRESDHVVLHLGLDFINPINRE